MGNRQFVTGELIGEAQATKDRVLAVYTRASTDGDKKTVEVLGNTISVIERLCARLKMNEGNMDDRLETARDAVFDVQSISLTVARALDANQELDMDDCNHLERLLRISVKVCEDVCTALDPVAFLGQEEEHANG